METFDVYCPNEDCPDYGVTGKKNIRRYGTYGKKKTQIYQCKTCMKTFSERRGSALFYLQTDEVTIYRVLLALAEGNSLRAAARIMGVDKDTVGRWLDRAAEHCEAISNYLVRNLHIKECQLGELWSFVKKGEKPHPVREDSKRFWRQLGMEQF